MLRTYEYRIYPNKKQKEQLAKHFGCVRLVYNWGLALKIESYQKENKRLSYFDLTKELTRLKKEKEFLKEISNAAMQQSLRHLDNAFTNFFREKKHFPKFKSKHSGKQSYSESNPVHVYFDENRIHLPKIKRVKAVLHRKFEGKIRTCTVKKTPTNKYFVSILVETNDIIPNKPIIEEETSLGIDLGIKDFAILSSGEKIANQKNLKKCLDRLKVLQKRFSKKKKGSNNSKKAKLKLALLHEKIVNRRNDFLHKISYKLTHENQVNTLCLETLSTVNMLKNHKLAQAISDASWGKFNELLEYKTDWYGLNLIRIGRFEPSSKTCSNCGNINNKLTLADRKWTCPKCGTQHDRDINAAINIKKFALQEQNLI